MSIRAKTAIILIAVGVGLLVSAVVHSPTYDEPGWVAAGLVHVQQARFEPGAVNPPLQRTVAMMAASAVIDLPYLPVRGDVSHRPEGFLGELFFEYRTTEAFRSLVIGRCFVAIVFLLSLLLVNRLYSKIFGRSELLPILLCGASPLLLGQAALFTSDVTAAAAGVLAYISIRGLAHDPRIRSAVFAGLAFGTAFLTKFTWLPILPIVSGIWILARLRSERSCRRLSGRLVVLITIVTLVSLLVVNAVYLFDRTMTPLGEIPFRSMRLAPENDSSEISAGERKANRFTGTWLGRIPVPLPICYVQGIDVQMRDFEPDRNPRSYLMGEWKDGGWWYYYLIGVLVKEPLPTLILGMIAVVTSFFPINAWKNKRNGGQEDRSAEIREGPRGLVPLRGIWGRWDDTGQAHPQFDSAPAQPQLDDYGVPIRTRYEWFCEHLLILTPAILIFVLVSSQTGFNRHLRYILPAYPFAFLFIARVAIYAQRWRWLKWTVRALLTWQIASVLWYAPHWLSYFNEAAGGPLNGHKWLLNSNIDWGQDVLLLREWQRNNPGAVPLNAAIYSPLDPALFDLRYVLPADSPRLKSVGAVDSARTVPVPGWYAVSVNLLKGTHWFIGSRDTGYRKVQDEFRSFERFTPVDRAGYSIYIYHITPEEADRVRAELETEDRERFPHLSESPQDASPEAQQ